MSKGLLNPSTENLVRPSRRYVAASIGSLFRSNRRTLQARNCNINSDMFSPTVLEGPSWENFLIQVFQAWKTASDKNKISSSIGLKCTKPPCSKIYSTSNLSLTQILSSSIEETMRSEFSHLMLPASLLA